MAFCAIFSMICFPPKPHFCFSLNYSLAISSSFNYTELHENIPMELLFFHIKQTVSFVFITLQEYQPVLIYRSVLTIMSRFCDYIDNITPMCVVFTKPKRLYLRVQSTITHIYWLNFQGQPSLTVHTDNISVASF